MSKALILSDKKAQKLLLYKQMRKIKITPNEGETRICVDGELEIAGPMEIEIVPNSMNFIIPDFKIKPTK
jgi:diacylglycerol kinase family enzyme